MAPEIPRPTEDEPVEPGLIGGPAPGGRTSVLVGYGPRSVVAKRYGIYYKKTPRGDVDHMFLTSLVDQSGTLRMQYMGVKFNPDEMLTDLRSLLAEVKAR